MTVGQACHRQHAADTAALLLLLGGDGEVGGGSGSDRPAGAADQPEGRGQLAWQD